MTAGVPSAARHGREAFAARFGRELAARDVVVLDRVALRRLDRIGVVVLDARVLVSDRIIVRRVREIGEHDDAVVRAKALTLVDPGQPERVVRRGGRAAGDVRAERSDGPGQRTTRGAGGRRVVGFSRSGRFARVVTLEAEIDPLAERMAEAVRRQGLPLVVAGKGSGLGARLRADEVAAGATLVRSVRSLQEEGLGVLLVSGSGAHAALRSADIGIGGDGHGPRPRGAPRC